MADAFFRKIWTNLSRSFFSFYDWAEDPESRSILRLAEKEEKDAEKAKQLAARIALRSVFFDSVFLARTSEDDASCWTRAFSRSVKKARIFSSGATRWWTDDCHPAIMICCCFESCLEGLPFWRDVRPTRESTNPSVSFLSRYDNFFSVRFSAPFVQA